LQAQAETAEKKGRRHAPVAADATSGTKDTPGETS
jgi:hypothetical protein